MTRESVAGGQAEAAPASAPEVFGDAWPLAERFARMLIEEGELRGLIGPRELPRLWTRHILNSTPVSDFVPGGTRFADVGSGAGFPGVVVALLRPDLDVHLIEPMDRRVTWLCDVAREIGIPNVTVVRARAEELHGRETFDVVSARAVAAMKKLVPWVAPLIKPGGRLVALKGERAAVEIEEAAKALRKHRLGHATVHEVTVLGTDEVTRVVTAERSA